MNFSIFESIPDTWAIDQIFPIMPIGGLDEAPDRRAVIILVDRVYLIGSASASPDAGVHAQQLFLAERDAACQSIRQ